MTPRKNKQIGQNVAMGVALGPGLGVGLGMALGNLPLGIGVGMMMGMAVGLALDLRHKEEGNRMDEKDQQRQKKRFVLFMLIGLALFLVLISLYVFRKQTGA